MYLDLKILKYKGFLSTICTIDPHLQKKIPSSPSLSLSWMLFRYPDMVRCAELMVRCMPIPPVALEASDKLPTDMALCSGFNPPRLAAAVPAVVPNKVAAAGESGGCA